MKKEQVEILIGSALLVGAAIWFLSSNHETASIPPIETPPETPIETPIIPPIEIPIETPVEPPIEPSTETYPKPTYTPKLRPYIIDKSHDIWHAADPSSYIEPNNEWVKYYANNINLVQIQYRTDEETYPNDINKDVWQNADYTLYTMQGDCEDESIVRVSIHRALGHKAIVVAGEMWFYDGSPNIRDYWYEWIDEYGNKNIKFVAPITQVKEFKAVPMYIFNDKITWSKYNENWYISFNM